MHPQSRLEIGNVVRMTAGDLEGQTGIVTKPIAETSPGHVLVYSAGYIQGVTVSKAEVLTADRSSEGYAQLAYNLIKLGSLVIEQGLL